MSLNLIKASNYIEMFTGIGILTVLVALSYCLFGIGHFFFNQ